MSVNNSASLISALGPLELRNTEENIIEINTSDNPVSLIQQWAIKHSSLLGISGNWLDLGSLFIKLTYIYKRSSKAIRFNCLNFE